MNDVLIRADDIIEHYHTLKRHHPKLAFVKVFEGFSHIDFTYGSHHALSQEILTTLKQQTLLDQTESRTVLMLKESAIELEESIKLQ